MNPKIFISALAILISSSMFAQTATPNVNKRQDNQQKRIAKGVKDGELTPKETEHLEKREAKIQSDKKAAKSDGVVTPKEKAKLEHEENKTSKHIHNQKHDAQKRK